MIQDTGHFVDTSKLYETFTDTEVKRQNECADTGMAMFNAKMIIEVLNGSIITTSINNVGTTI